MGSIPPLIDPLSSSLLCSTTTSVPATAFFHRHMSCLTSSPPVLDARLPTPYLLTDPRRPSLIVAASTTLMSNYVQGIGATKNGKVADPGFRGHAPAKLGKNLRGEESVILVEDLMAPAVIYVKQVLDIVSKESNKGIKGIAHTRLGALVYNDSFSVPRVSKWIQKAGGIEDGEMKGTFSMGIGMVLVVSKEVSDRVVKECEMVYHIGDVF
ncbi:unnamed protein product [Lactuca saligna]|uniref:Phosphoribosylformylglycinamidine cyclo-ligase n=1 Tax=Lactuca saligna TaxID=75948 RepID=A0AA35YWY1_LACSI|nr:unnamed protein product [Lactuca saligna]